MAVLEAQTVTPDEIETSWLSLGHRQLHQVRSDQDTLAVPEVQLQQIKSDQDSLAVLEAQTVTPDQVRSRHPGYRYGTDSYTRSDQDNILAVTMA